MKKMKTCPVCGKAFEASRNGGGNITCGKECGIIHRQRTKAANYKPRPAEDLTGQAFFELTALKYLGHNVWRWRCSCGKETKAKAADVKAGAIRSCGHLRDDASRRSLSEGKNGLRGGTNVNTIAHVMAGRKRKNNTSGVTGVRLRRYAGGVVAYSASITVQGKEIYLGQYGTLEDAAKARVDAEHKYFAPLIEQDKTER